MIEYTIHKQDAKSAEIIIIDPETGLTHNRTINIADCDTPEKLAERFASHVRAFGHRINIGVITESSIPVVASGLPTDIVIDDSLSAASKLALATVIEAKVAETLTSAESELEKLNAKPTKDRDLDAIAAAAKRVDDLSTGIESLLVKKASLESALILAENINIVEEQLTPTVDPAPVAAAPKTKP
jgi:hypothetical protein